MTAALLLALTVSFPAAQHKAPTAPGKPQAEVASKTANFGMVKASDASVKKALASKAIDAAMKLDKKKGSFTGTVLDVFETKDHQTVYLNFANPWKSAISGKVASSSFSKFPKLADLKGKAVLISGTYDLYHGEHPQITMTSPDQLKLIVK